MIDQDIPLQNYSNNRNGWIVCISCVIINYLRTSVVYSFGVFIAEFKKIYGSKMAELDWIAVTVIALTDILAPIPTLIIRKVGRKGYMICSLVGTLLLTAGCFTSSLVDQVSWLFLTFSFSFSVGCCFIFLSSTLVMNEFFPPSHRYHVLATSANLLSYPASIMVSNPLYAWIIKLTTWRIAFIVAGMKIFVLGCICSFLFLIKKPKNNDFGVQAKPCANDKTLSDDLSKEMVDKKLCDIFKTSERICWLTATVIIHASVVVPVINLPHYMEDKGYDKLGASLPLVIRSAFDIITCLVMIQVGHKFQRHLIYVPIVSCQAIALLFFVWPAIDLSFVDIMILNSVLGIVGILPFIYAYAISLEVMDMKADIAWTSYCFSAGLGSLLSPIVSGALFDLRGSYDDAFYVTAALNVLVGLILLGIPLKKCYRNRKVEYKQLN